MILVVGSTGSLGSSVAFKLARAGRPVAALVRDAANEKARALDDAGIKLLVGDLKDVASFARALAGVRTVVCTASSTLSRREGDSIETVDRAGVQSLIAEAEKAGVGQFIFVSFDHSGQTYPLALAKRAAEERLKASRLNWTILQPSCFCEVWLSPAVGFDVAAGKVRIYGAGDRPVHYIALDDVAEATVAAVDNPRATRKTFRFGGPTPGSQREAAALFERHTGRRFTLETMSLADIQSARAGTTDPLTLSFLGLFEQIGAGFASDPGWEQQLGVKARTLEDWVRNAVRS